jgi:hypothetical protein
MSPWRVGIAEFYIKISSDEIYRILSYIRDNPFDSEAARHGVPARIPGLSGAVTREQLIALAGVLQYIGSRGNVEPEHMEGLETRGDLFGLNWELTTAGHLFLEQYVARY